MRCYGVFAVSILLTFIVILNAYTHKKQFYPAVVYITKSNVSMAVIYIQAFILVLLVGKLMRKVFFGQLRAAEFEHLMERSWYAITETCLAFTVFRDDFNPRFVAFFTILLFLKSFHWLAEDRVDYMERSPVIGLLFHIRVQSLLLMLSALDILFIMHAYQSTVTKGASVQLVFGFEYSILIIMIANISIKYTLHAIDSHWDSPWENKAVVLLYTELVVGFLKVSLYVSFVVIMIRKYTLPLFAFRPMYYTMRSFKNAFNDVVLSRRAIRNMNTLYPDATRAELAAVDNVCIICREEMNSGAKKLPCNHIFHAACLRSWFQRQQTCPTCRLNILQTPTTPQTQPAPAQAQQQQQQPQQQAPPAAGTIPQAVNMQMPNAQSGSQQPINQIPNPAFFGTVPNFAPFIGFPFPPPPMPQNLATLTPAELTRMEGRERQHIEARIQCLRNIQVMLDASVVMMQQYSAIANRFPSMLDPRDAESQTVDISTEVPSTSGSLSTSKPEVQDPTLQINSDLINEEKNTAGPSTATLTTDNLQKIAGVDVTNEPISTDSADKLTVNSEIKDSDHSTADELRRRRLQKFHQDNQ